MDGMRDIIPPAPVAGGLAALIDPAGAHPALLALLVGLVVLLPLALWLGRHRLQAAFRLSLAERALRGLPPAQAAERIVRLLQRHLGLVHLHPDRTPAGIDTAAWEDLVSALHAARFASRPVDLGDVQPCLARVFSASRPRRGRSLDAGHGPQSGKNLAHLPDSAKLHPGYDEEGPP